MCSQLSKRIAEINKIGTTKQQNKCFLCLHINNCLLKRQTGKYKHSNSWSHKLWEVILAKSNWTHVQSICQYCHWPICLGRSWWMPSGLPRWFQVDHRNYFLEWLPTFALGANSELATAKESVWKWHVHTTRKHNFLFCYQQGASRIHWKIQHPWRKGICHDAFTLAHIQFYTSNRECKKNLTLEWRRWWNLIMNIPLT